MIRFLLIALFAATGAHLALDMALGTTVYIREAQR